MKFRMFKDSKGEWRWRLVATNGNVIADSGEGYSRKIDCVAAIDLVKSTESAPVEEESYI